MSTSSLEINENEYCIKLDKASFDLSTIRHLINRIQAEQTYFRKSWSFDDGDLRSRDGQWEENFDRLSDK